MLNGSALGEKLNKRQAALIARHDDVFSGNSRKARHSWLLFAVLNYSSSVDWLNASPSHCAGLSGTC